ncbi:MAG: SEC-C metal-binding domain-containing protein, partial [Rhodospirillaceae bacterium]
DAMHEEWDISGLHEECLRLLDLDLPISDWAAEEGIADEEIRDRITKASDEKMDNKVANVGGDLMRRVEKSVVLQMVDQGWRDHLAQLDMLRQAVNLRAFGQKTPLLEYQRESFDMFNELLASLRQRVTGVISRVELKREPAPEDLRPKAPKMQTVKEEAQPSIGGGSNQLKDVTAQRSLPRVAPESRNPADPSTWGKVSRNESCPCGSGKKYKHCHGAVEDVA